MDPYIGQIVLFPYTFAPKGWLPCAGQTLPISQNQALFSLLGNNFGGNGVSDFALPTLKAPGPGLQYCIAVTIGAYPSRD